MPFYTVCTWEPSQDAGKTGLWYDSYGFTTKAAATEEIEYSHSHEPRGWVTIIVHGYGEQTMIAARDGLRPPRGWTIAR